MAETNYKVCVTNDYLMFKKLVGNRNVKSTNAIRASINEVGQIPIPIIVNEKKEVVDGQHRLDLFEELGLPVYYLVIPGIGTKEATSINNAQRKWDSKDYLYSYAKQGNPNYIYISELLEKYKKTSIQEILAIMNGVIMSGGGHSTKFKEGKLVVTEKQKELLEQTLPELADLLNVITAIGGQRRITITTISWVLNFSGVNRGRLIKCIKEKYTLIRPVADKHALLRDLEDIYNKGIRSANNRIYFEAKYKEFLLEHESQY